MKPLPNHAPRAVLFALAALPLGGRAQQDAKLRRIGFLALRSRSTQTNPEVSTYDTFAQAMRDLGYFEGKNLVIEWRYAEGRFEPLPALAAASAPRITASAPSFLRFSSGCGARSSSTWRGRA